MNIRINDNNNNNNNNNSIQKNGLKSIQSLKWEMTRIWKDTKVVPSVVGAVVTVTKGLEGCLNTISPKIYFRIL